MTYRILKVILVFVLLIDLSSCYVESYGRYRNRNFYVHRKKYAWHHKHRHGGW